MDSHTISALGRLDVVETGRRRRWSEEEKIRIVSESLAGPRLISATARRHNISRALLLSWRRALTAQSKARSAPTFVPAVIAAEPSASVIMRSNGGRIEIVLPHGRRVIVDASVDSAALARVLEVVERQ
jgi:transposase